METILQVGLTGQFLREEVVATTAVDQIALVTKV
jgi:hypothetical protein